MRRPAEKLFFKLPEPLKKAQYYTDYFSVYYETAPNLLGRNLVRLVTLKDLTVRSDSVVQDL
jgi:hypothetical protein